MPRTKASAAIAAAITPPPPVQVAPVSVPLDDSPAAWSDLLGEMEAAADAELYIYREPEKGQGGAEFCFSCTPDDFPKFSDLLAHIKGDPDCGPGRYSLRLKRGTQWAGRKTVSIAGRRLAPGAIAPIAPAPSSTDTLVREMQNSQTQFMQSLVLALVGRPQAESKGGGMMEVVEVAKLLTDGRKERTPVSELRELLSLRELFKPNEGEGSGDGGDGDGWLGALVKSFAPAIATLATAPSQPAPPHATAPRLAALPNNPAPAVRPGAPPPQAAAPTAAGGGAPQAGNPLGPFISIMMRGALNDSDPASYAEVAIDLLGEHAPMLIARPDLLELLCQIEPRAAGHREWFGELIEAARELLTPDDEETEPAGGLTGAETDTDGSGHAPAVPVSVA